MVILTYILTFWWERSSDPFHDYQKHKSQRRKLPPHSHCSGRWAAIRRRSESPYRRDPLSVVPMNRGSQPILKIHHKHPPKSPSKTHIRTINLEMKVFITKKPSKFIENLFSKTPEHIREKKKDEMPYRWSWEFSPVLCRRFCKRFWFHCHCWVHHHLRSDKRPRYRTAFFFVFVAVYMNCGF